MSKPVNQVKFQEIAFSFGWASSGCREFFSSLFFLGGGGVPLEKDLASQIKLHKRNGSP